MRRLIWVCTVRLCPIYRTLGLHGLNTETRVYPTKFGIVTFILTNCNINVSAMGLRQNVCLTDKNVFKADSVVKSAKGDESY